LESGKRAIDRRTLLKGGSHAALAVSGIPAAIVLAEEIRNLKPSEPPGSHVFVLQGTDNGSKGLSWTAVSHGLGTGPVTAAGATSSGASAVRRPSKR